MIVQVVPRIGNGSLTVAAVSIPVTSIINAAPMYGRTFGVMMALIVKRCIWPGAKYASVPTHEDVSPLLVLQATIKHPGTKVDICGVLESSPQSRRAFLFLDLF